MEKDQNQGLVTAYLLDNNGGGKEIGWPEIESWSPKEGFIWVHLDGTAPETERWLKEKSALDDIACDILLAGEVQPRSLVTRNGVLVILRGVNLNPGADPEDMVSVRLWADNNRVITTWRRYVMSVDDIRKAIAGGYGPASPGELITDLADRLVDRMSDVIEDIDNTVDKLEEEVPVTDPGDIRKRLTSIRRQTIGLRRYLAPQREALGRLYIEQDPWLKGLDRARLREITDRTAHYIEELDFARDRTMVVQDELHSHLTEYQNRRMYVLSTVAAIFLPLTFITGLLGINVAGIPGAGSHWAFLVVSLSLIIALFGEVSLLRRSKWL